MNWRSLLHNLAAADTAAEKVILHGCPAFSKSAALLAAGRRPLRLDCWYWSIAWHSFEVAYYCYILNFIHFYVFISNMHSEYAVSRLLGDPVSRPIAAPAGSGDSMSHLSVADDISWRCS